MPFRRNPQLIHRRRLANAHQRVRKRSRRAEPRLVHGRHGRVHPLLLREQGEPRIGVFGCGGVGRPFGFRDGCGEGGEGGGDGDCGGWGGEGEGEEGGEDGERGGEGGFGHVFFFRLWNLFAGLGPDVAAVGIGAAIRNDEGTFGIQRGED